MDNNLPLIIIGTGLAGYNLAKEYRKLNTTRELILITEDEGHFYSKPQLSTALHHKKDPEQLIITSVDNMKDQLHATIYPHASVTAIDPPQAQITVKTTHTSFTLSYGELVLAIGAAPRAFPFANHWRHHFRINTLQEYNHFRQSGNYSDCTIIGSGLVGCEFAHDLRNIIPTIRIMTPDRAPLQGLVPECIGKALQQALATLHIEWFTQTTLSTITCEEDTAIVETHQGHTLSTSSLLTAIGLLPRLELAIQANLHTRQGIVVNAFLQTSDPNIYALGDCVEIEGICRQYVSPILHSARALAQTLSGTKTAVIFPPSAISLKVNTYPVVTFPPPKNQKGEWEMESREQDYKALFWDHDEKLAGYALSGKYVEERQHYLTRLHSPRLEWACT